MSTAAFKIPAVSDYGHKGISTFNVMIMHDYGVSREQIISREPLDMMESTDVLPFLSKDYEGAFNIMVHSQNEDSFR